MEPILERLIQKLPKLDSEYSEREIKKIHRLIPVPNDYKIIWADIQSYGGYPAGVVITEQAIILKATKDEVKKSNAEIKSKNKGVNKADKVKPLKGIYQIIPWEYYSPDDYEVKITHDEKGKTRYLFTAGGKELAWFYSSSLYSLFASYNTALIAERRETLEVVEDMAFSSVNTINAEGTMFNAAYGADQSKTGHGIYAEEASAKLDWLSGEQSTVVGRDNAKNGPDKIVNSSPVQCKYCKTAYTSVNACFKNDAGTRTFRYYDLNGKPMKIEVPSDQYLSAIEYMKDRISKGNVPGVSDPKAAYDIIRKGKLTYSQALNLAKAGTIESISFDAASGAVTCLSALGISSVVTFAQVYWRTKDYKKAAKYALNAGLQVYGLSFLGGIIASQVSRTAVSNVLKPAAMNVSNALSPQTVQELINAFRALAGKKAIYGAAAQKSFAKFLGSNAITEGVLFVVFSIPDTVRVFSRKISGAQYAKNMLSLVGSIAGSIAASVGAGAVIGKKAGETINKTAGSIIGLVAGAGGGLVVGTSVKVVGDLIREDDAIITTRMFNAILVNLAIEYMLTDTEQNKLIELLDEDAKELKKLQQGLLKETAQAETIEEYLRPKLDLIAKQRERISEEKEDHLVEQIDSFILSGGLAYGM